MLETSERFHYFESLNYESETKYIFLCKLYHQSFCRFYMRCHYDHHHYYGVTRDHSKPRPS